MQALRKAVQAVLPNTRSMAGLPSLSTEARWSNYWPKPAQETWTAQQTQKNVRKEMIGFLILGPASAALMVYDLIFGLEEHHEHHPIPPYPWMRIRRLSGMPWGDDSLLDLNLVAKEWPPAEGLPEHKD